MKDLMSIIPFLNQYPVWTQVLVLICAMVVIVILIFVPRKPTSIDAGTLNVRHTIDKAYEINVSLISFEKATVDWSRQNGVCKVVYNLMNQGDLSITIQDFFIHVSLEKDGTKGVHRAYDKYGTKLGPVVVDAGMSKSVEAYFDVSKAIYCVPDRVGADTTLRCDIGLEAIAQDGLRENLIFKANTLMTKVVESEGDYFHEVQFAGAAYETSAIKYLGGHAAL